MASISLPRKPGAAVGTWLRDRAALADGEVTAPFPVRPGAGAVRGGDDAARGPPAPGPPTVTSKGGAPLSANAAAETAPAAANAKRLRPREAERSTS